MPVERSSQCRPDVIKGTFNVLPNVGLMPSLKDKHGHEKRKDYDDDSGMGADGTAAWAATLLGRVECYQSGGAITTCGSFNALYSNILSD